MIKLKESLTILIVLALATAGITGCSKEEPPAPVRNTEVDVEKLAAEAREAEQKEHEKQAEEAKAAVEKEAPPKPSGRSVGPRLPGSIGYLPAVMGAYSSSKVKLAIAEVMADIQRFYALEGHYPESLDELAEWRSRPLPDLGGRTVFDYDPATGKLGVTEAQQQ